MNCGYKNNNIISFIELLKANKYWYVSGTPFTTLRGLMNCFKFIKLKIKYNNAISDIDYNHLSNNIIDGNVIIKILNYLCIRNMKENVINEINIPNYKETNYWVEQTDFEKKLYNNAITSNKSKNIIQQLCCHPLASDIYNHFNNNNTDIDINNIKTKVLEYNKNIINVYTKKINLLTPENKEYSMLKSMYTNKITQSKYLLKSFTDFEEKVSKNNITEDCIICMEKINNPTMTSCGHIFCNNCIKMSLKYKNKCPACRKIINDKLIVISKQEKKEEKYGGKLTKIINIIKEIISNKDNRIIIFSQWDNMLNLIQQTLTENNIYSSYLRGNTYVRNAQIKYFKEGVNSSNNTNQIIMLSLQNSASGTNLTEATHIIFVEPINEKKNVIKGIENQAIGRAVRLGQKKEVSVIRVFTKNTIEEEIYNKYYIDNINV
jgi:SNF2 family DNA or RNA helicase